MMSKTIPVALACVLGVILLIMITTRLYSQQHIVTVNMQAVIAVPAHLVAKRMTKAQQQAFITRYSQQLSKTIKAYGKHHRVTVIAARALYNAGADVTAQIIQANLERLRGQHA